MKGFLDMESLSTMKKLVSIFLKYPEPGRVKTRLAADLGDQSAAAAYRSMVAEVFRQIVRSGIDSIVVHFDPADREAEVKAWLRPYLSGFFGNVHFQPQVDGNLGDRLLAGAQWVAEHFADAAVATIGADCVSITPEILSELWQKLADNHDVVYGPTKDGGYYLVGWYGDMPAEAFGPEIEWSTESTLASSIEALTGANRTVSLLPEQEDIDHVSEWNAVSAMLSERPCVFFDRDGVVNVSPGPGYVLDESAFHLSTGIKEALQVTKQSGYLAVLVTSQKGVGKKLMTQQTLDLIHDKMQQELGESRFDAIYAFTGTDDCPHQPKPDPEMILSAIRDFGINP
ncbi:MAG: TIGR04282 family arsenosugar biosynthesis glycosyltransferase, partial [Verrucomicrobiota bacterium]